MEINWTVLTYFVIGLFALSGFFKGWWKEAVTTVFLTLLIVLLQNPAFAQAVIEILNSALATIWDLIPESFLPTLNSILNDVLAVDTRGDALQANAADPNTWLIILILFIAFAILFSRASLPNSVRRPQGHAYAVTPAGSVLGGLIGGLNGFIIISLVREYLDGRNLPGSGLSREIAAAGGRTVSTASSGVSIKAVDVPAFTLLDSFLPWVLIGIGLVVLVALLRNRVGMESKNGFRKVVYKEPYGYQRIEYKS